MCNAPAIAAAAAATAPMTAPRMSPSGEDTDARGASADSGTGDDVGDHVPAVIVGNIFAVADARAVLPFSAAC